jgi:hypothetical protein
MRRVILESFYHGDTDGNVTYARAYVRDSPLRDEAPIASHSRTPNPVSFVTTSPPNVSSASPPAWLGAGRRCDGCLSRSRDLTGHGTQHRQCGKCRSAVEYQSFGGLTP